MTGRDVALAAQALVGTRFRLHGRDPATGLDCVGLVSAALGASAPAGYRLRNSNIAAGLAWAPAAGLVEATGTIEPGDVMLVRSGPAQHHLLVAGPSGDFIHAHAGLRRVVVTPGPLSWPVERHWRLKD
ncbi:MAG TPA: peptidoglycan endopeptidase [Croceibacterium sp.]|nr:peptidoglycan endopeptidase [Croceibacterium sp.]